jgi:hypothetical protein
MAPTRADIEKLVDEIERRPVHNVSLGLFTTFMETLKQYLVAERENEDANTLMHATIDPLLREFVASLKREGKIAEDFQIPWPTMLADLAREKERKKMADRELEIRKK